MDGSIQKQPENRDSPAVCSFLRFVWHHGSVAVLMRYPGRLEESAASQKNEMTRSYRYIKNVMNTQRVDSVIRNHHGNDQPDINSQKTAFAKYPKNRIIRTSQF